MSKRRKTEFTGSLYHGYGTEMPSRGLRQHRDKDRKVSKGRFIAQSTLKKGHGSRMEAQMIPGMIPDQVYGFPKTILTKLRYSDSIQLGITSGVLNYHVFRANSLFDPDYTGTGHQPMYFDQYAGIYLSYQVLGSKITVTWNTTTANELHLVGITGEDDTSGSTTATTRMEQNNSVTDRLAYNLAGGHDQVTQTMTFSSLGDLGIAAKDDGESATAVSGNPDIAWYYHLWAVPESANSTVLKAVVNIEYIVKFSQLKTPAGS